LKKNELIKYSITRFFNSYLDNISHLVNYPFSKPINISIGITQKCNLKCKHCDIWKLKDSNELSVDQWKKFLMNARQWLGTFQVSFAGGEPLLYNGILEILEYASSLGIITSIVTSGSTLTDRKIDELLKTEVDSINISLDSMNPEIHDGIRGVKGVHKKVMNAIEKLCESGHSGKIIIASVIMNSNIDEIIPLAEYTKEKGVCGISYQVVTDNFGREYKHDWFLDSDNFVKNNGKLDKVFNTLSKLKSKGYPILNAKRQLDFSRLYFLNPIISFPFSCKVGFNNFRIGPSGNVQFCNLSKPYGNILDEDLKKLWTSEMAQRRRRELRHCKLPCSIQNCYFRKTISENWSSFKRRW
jgi:MoaA/NifB/PqqE/SkfB family radical SAM enzyme